MILLSLCGLNAHDSAYSFQSIMSGLRSFNFSNSWNSSNWNFKGFSNFSFPKSISEIKATEHKKEVGIGLGIFTGFALLRKGYNLYRKTKLTSDLQYLCDCRFKCWQMQDEESKALVDMKNRLFQKTEELGVSRAQIRAANEHLQYDISAEQIYSNSIEIERIHKEEIAKNPELAELQKMVNMQMNQINDLYMSACEISGSVLWHEDKLLKYMPMKEVNALDTKFSKREHFNS